MDRARLIGGRLITLEGIDGVGKTTHAALLGAFLRGQGLNVVDFREPGSTELGEQLRRLIKAGVMRSALAELLLFAAARAELVASLLRPALTAGMIVLLDRFSDSTLAYQGAMGHIPEDALRAVCAAAADGLTPDLTLWLDLEPLAALQRRYPLTAAEGVSELFETQQPDVIEARDGAYFARVRQRYLELWQAEPQRIERVSAGGTKEETAAEIRRLTAARLEGWANG